MQADQAELKLEEIVASTRDSNPPVLARNLLFLETISWQDFPYIFYNFPVFHLISSPYICYNCV